MRPWISASTGSPARMPVYIGYPRELLAAEEPLSLHPDRVIIEVPGELRARGGRAACIRTLRERGHHIALDAFTPGLTQPELLDWSTK